MMNDGIKAAVEMVVKAMSSEPHVTTAAAGRLRGRLKRNTIFCNAPHGL